jgi:hypothetical protein
MDIEWVGDVDLKAVGSVRIGVLLPQQQQHQRNNRPHAWYIYDETFMKLLLCIYHLLCAIRMVFMSILNAVIHRIICHYGN